MTTREREWEVQSKLTRENRRREERGGIKTRYEGRGIQTLKKRIMQAAKQQYYEAVFLQLWPWATT